MAILALLALAPSSLARANSLTDSDIDRVYAEMNQRRATILQTEIDDFRSQPRCNVPQAPNVCLIGKVAVALAQLHLARNNVEIAAANSQLVEVAQALPNVPGFDTDGMPGREGGPDSQEFHSMYAGLFYRIERFFGAGGSMAAGRLDAATENSIRAVFWEWARNTCRTEDAEAGGLWSLARSENNDAQHVASCWEAADLLRHSPQYANQNYADGSTPQLQFSKWSAYIKSYLRSRARFGLIEYFSPTYAKYTVESVYNYADFSDDPELARLAKQFLDLWWCEWAQEQTGGEFGGAQARVYLKAIPDAAPMRGASWMYFGQGGNAREAASPNYATAIASSYAPPPVVVDIALDVAGRGSYAAFARAPGLLASGSGKSIRVIDPAQAAILRVAYVTPEFAMGSAVMPKLPFADWFPGSSQDRWAGVVENGDPQARVGAFPEGTNREKHYNALWAIQSKATQILQEAQLPYSRGAGAMRVWFGPALEKVERDGWVFTQGPAYVAVHIVSGGYHWDPSEPGWLVLNDPRSPIIIQAADKSDFHDFGGFQTAVLQSPLVANPDFVSFSGLGDAGKLTWYVSSTKPGSINGAPVTSDAREELRSPFLNQAFGSGHIRIAKGNRSEVLQF